MVVVVLELDRGDVSDLAVQADLVEPPDPTHGGEFEVVDATPGPFVTDAFGLVEPDHGLGHRVVIAVTDAADRRDRTHIGKSVAVANRGVLAPGIAVMDQPVDKLVGLRAGP